MTESEATAKWCPFGRVGHRDGMALNEPENPNWRTNCIGSGCMAWRWSEHGAEHGYCGLAGMPTT